MTAGRKLLGFLGHGVWSVGFGLASFAGIVSADVLIPADDPNINYYGRWSFNSPKSPSFTWEGCAVEASFPGPSIGVSLTDNGNGQAIGIYDVEIDGVRQTQVITTQSGTRTYSISTSLSTASHTVKVICRNETHWDLKSFGGFYLANGKVLNTAPAKPVRKIEFLGDSWTAGYGDEAYNTTGAPTWNRGCSNLDSLSNANRNFASIISKSFRAQPMITAYSGKGLVHNLSDAAGTSAQPMPYYYDSIFTEGASPAGTGKWDFTKWTANLAVICLGINDFSTGFPGDQAYITAYDALIARVLGHYPNAWVLCVQTNSTFVNGAVTDSEDADIRSVIAAETTSLGHKKVSTVVLPASGDSATQIQLYGCDWHPCLAADQLIAKTLIAQIVKMTGWDTGATAIQLPLKLDGPNAGIRADLTGSAGQQLLTVRSLENSAQNIDVMDIEGRRLAHGEVGRGRVFQWNTSGAARGLYLVGNRDIGWTRIALKNP